MKNLKAERWDVCWVLLVSLNQENQAPVFNFVGVMCWGGGSVPQLLSLRSPFCSPAPLGFLSITCPANTLRTWAKCGIPYTLPLRGCWAASFTCNSSRGASFKELQEADSSAKVPPSAAAMAAAVLTHFCCHPGFLCLATSSLSFMLLHDPHAATSLPNPLRTPYPVPPCLDPLVPAQLLGW